MEINRSQNLNFRPFLLPIFESKEKNVRNKNQLQIQRFAIDLFEIQKIDSSLNRSQILEFGTDFSMYKKCDSTLSRSQNRLQIPRLATDFSMYKKMIQG